MTTYHKIQSIFKRDDNGKFTAEYSMPEFEYLKNNMWEFTEKVDGTNIRIAYEEGKLIIGGRTERAQIPAHLFNELSNIFSGFDQLDMTLYGEGYGMKINGGEQYIKDGVGFILFDVRVGRWWLQREDVEKIAKEYGVPIVPFVGIGTLQNAIVRCQEGFQSEIGACNAEGLVLRPTVSLFARSGERIITKVKERDYR